jgi:hypothetical protein
LLVIVARVMGRSLTKHLAVPPGNAPARSRARYDVAEAERHTKATHEDNSANAEVNAARNS